MRSRRGILVASALLAACAAPQEDETAAPDITDAAAVERSADQRATTEATDPTGLPDPWEHWDDHHAAYEWLRTALAEEHLDDPALAASAVDLLVVDEQDLDEARQLAATIEDGEGHRELHSLLLRTRPNPDVLFDYLERHIADTIQKGESRPTRRGLIYGWEMSYFLESALEAYEQSGEPRFAELARDAMLAMLDHRDDVEGRLDEFRGRVLEAWGTDHLLDDGRYTNVVTHGGRIAAPMARYAWIVEGDPSLHEDHAADADLLLDAATATIMEFDDEFRTSDDGTYGYYWRDTHDRIDALNHQTSVGQAHLYLAQLDDDAQLHRRRDQLLEFTRRSLHREHGGTVSWQYAPEPGAWTGSAPEPIWKGQVTLRFLVHATRLGQGFDEYDLPDIAASIERNVIRDGVELNSVIAETVEPLDEVETRHGGAENLLPYLLLADYHDGLETTILDVAQDHDVEGWFSHPKTVVGYAHRLDD